MSCVVLPKGQIVTILHGGISAQVLQNWPCSDLVETSVPITSAQRLVCLFTPGIRMCPQCVSGEHL